MIDGLTGIVLAGGKAARMGGRDKAFLKIDDESIIDRQLRMLQKIFKEIIIVTNSMDSYKDLKKAKTIPDLIVGQGPLGGIYSGLLASDSFYNFVIACDMPFVSEELIRYMLEDINGYDAVIAEYEGKPQPLCAVYSKDCITLIKRQLDNGRLRMKDFIQEINAKIIDENRLKRLDPKGISFFNINTREDHQCALESLSKV